MTRASPLDKLLLQTTSSTRWTLLKKVFLLSCTSLILLLAIQLTKFKTHLMDERNQRCALNSHATILEKLYNGLNHRIQIMFAQDISLCSALPSSGDLRLTTSTGNLWAKILSKMVILNRNNWKRDWKEPYLVTREFRIKKLILKLRGSKW